MHKDVSREEEMKRQTVFAKPRKTVLVKILAMGRIAGLQVKNRNEEIIDTQHANEAEKRGLDFQAYRLKGDTGFCLFQKEPGIRVDFLDIQLLKLGLRYVGGHWQNVEGKGPVNTLVFSTEGEEQPMPAPVKDLFRLRYNHCTVWCNLKYNPDGKGQHRLDTINLAKGIRSQKKARELEVVGNTYRLKKL